MQDPKIPGIQNVWANQKNSRATIFQKTLFGFVFFGFLGAKNKWGRT